MRVLFPIIAITLSAALLSPAIAFAQEIETIVEGRKAWLRLNCYGCHGDNGGGGMGANIIVRGQRAINIQLAMGGALVASGMPSYLGVPNVRQSDYNDLAAYMRSIGTADEPKWHDWWRR